MFSVVYFSRGGTNNRPLCRINETYLWNLWKPSLFFPIQGATWQTVHDHSVLTGLFFVLHTAHLLRPLLSGRWSAEVLRTSWGMQGFFFLICTREINELLLLFCTLAHVTATNPAMTSCRRSFNFIGVSVNCLWRINALTTAASRKKKKMQCHHFLLFLSISYKDLSWSKWSTQFIFMLYIFINSEHVICCIVPSFDFRFTRVTGTGSMKFVAAKTGLLSFHATTETPSLLQNHSCWPRLIFVAFGKTFRLVFTVPHA